MVDIHLPYISGQRPDENGNRVLDGTLSGTTVLLGDTVETWTIPWSAGIDYTYWSGGYIRTEQITGTAKVVVLTPSGQQELASYAVSYPAVYFIPEPSTMILTLGGLSALLSRRRAVKGYREWNSRPNKS